MSLVNLASNYPVLAFLVLIGALGAPLPLNVAMAMAAALARQGRMHISLLFLVCAAAAVAGDCLGYAAGRFGVRLLPRGWALPVRLQRRLPSRALPAWLPLQMGMVIFLTRWLVTAPAPLVNFAAGARQYGWRRFLRVDLSGEALWCLLALAPGYALGGGQAGLALVGAAGLVLTLVGAMLARCVPGRLSASVVKLSTRYAVARLARE